jgi:hypothetical protein
MEWETNSRPESDLGDIGRAVNARQVFALGYRQPSFSTSAGGGSVQEEALQEVLFPDWRR